MSSPTSTSTQYIIVSVLEDNNIIEKESSYFESYVRTLQREFKNLITNLGNDVESLKDGKNFAFDEKYVLLVKALLRQHRTKTALRALYAACLHILV